VRCDSRRECYFRASLEQAEKYVGQRFLLIGLCGSENPTRANFPFVWAAALKEAGNDVRIELAGDAVVLMRTAVSESITPVGCPLSRVL
jgi:predicted peroxiredoxin